MISPVPYSVVYRLQVGDGSPTPIPGRDALWIDGIEHIGSRVWISRHHRTYIVS